MNMEITLTNENMNIAYKSNIMQNSDRKKWILIRVKNNQMTSQCLEIKHRW